jgi:hypothetical protein
METWTTVHLTESEAAFLNNEAKEAFTTEGSRDSGLHAVCHSPWMITQEPIDSPSHSSPYLHGIGKKKRITTSITKFMATWVVLAAWKTNRSMIALDHYDTTLVSIVGHNSLI